MSIGDKFVNVKVNRDGSYEAGPEPKGMDTRTKSALIVGGAIIGSSIIRSIGRFFRF